MFQAATHLGVCSLASGVRMLARRTGGGQRRARRVCYAAERPSLLHVDAGAPEGGCPLKGKGALPFGVLALTVFRLYDRDWP